MTPAAHCSDGARERGDPLIATAPPTRRWLLLEQTRGWPEKILTSPDLAGWGRAVNAVVAEQQGRLLLVRRHGRQIACDRTWTVVDAVTRQEVGGRWSPGAGLAEAMAAFAGTTPLTEPARERYLVCTHGTHDLCCAVRGRPVAAALAAAYPEQTWECSHLGGDRFAGNVLVLPSGAYYGALDGPDAVACVTDHAAGRVGAGHLRGVTTQPPVVQAAISRVLADLGPAPVDAITGRVVGEREGGGVSVEVSGHPSASSVEVEVRRLVLPPAHRSCRAVTNEPVVTYAARLVAHSAPRTPTRG